MILILKDCKYGIKKLDHQFNLIFKLKREQDRQFNSDYKGVSEKCQNGQFSETPGNEKVSNTKCVGKNLFYFCGINDALNNTW